MSSTPEMTGALPGHALREAHPPELLAGWLEDARERTLSLVEDLDDAQLLGPRLPTTNPLRWELGHLAWFAEKWLLRRQGAASIRPDADALFDSAIPHDSRWGLPLPTGAETIRFMRQVLGRVLDRLASPDGRAADTYFVLLAIFHEDMHGEAIACTRQTLAYPSPDLGGPGPDAFSRADGQPLGDAAIPAGRFLLGSLPGEPFVFDNEKWAHPVDLRPFAIARAPVTQAEFAAFVEAGGYSRREFWSDQGWRWREAAGAEQPVYWRREGRSWFTRLFDQVIPLEQDWPVHHVCWHEAQAYCRWANRRLPTEVEWELAAASWPEGAGLSSHKRRFPWGHEFPVASRANLDGTAPRCVPVVACPDGDSAWGCRQLLGNVWEWTASDFVPYPGFAVDPYADYSRPWFGSHKVLRGGSWLTRGRLIRNTWRNFYRPDRRDVLAGFRTCALDA